MKIAWVATGFFLLCMVGASAQQEVQTPPGTMSWDSFKHELKAQADATWISLNDQAPVYGIVPTLEFLPTIVYVNVVLCKPNGDRYYGRREITMTDLTLQGGEQKLQEVRDALASLHYEALLWQSQGVLANREQMSAPWTKEDADLKESVGDSIINIMNEGPPDMQRDDTRVTGNSPKHGLCAMLVFVQGKKYVALTAEYPNNWGVENYLVVKKYAIEDLTGPKAPDMILELQHDIFEIRRREGYVRVPDLRLV